MSWVRVPSSASRNALLKALRLYATGNAEGRNSQFGTVLERSGCRVSRLMGHSNEAITGAIYTHEIERRDNAERTREKMGEAFGSGEVALAIAR